MRSHSSIVRPVLVAMACASLALASRKGSAAPRAAESVAAEAWHGCREMEELGDATACWKLWLRKYRAVGHEAEIYVAEQRAATPGGSAPSAAARPVPVVAEPTRPVPLAAEAVKSPPAPDAESVVVVAAGAAAPQPDAPVKPADPAVAPAAVTVAATAGAVATPAAGSDATNEPGASAPGEPEAVAAVPAPSDEPTPQQPTLQSPDSSRPARPARRTIGLAVTPGLGFGAVTYNYGSTFQGQSQYEMPGWVVGGGLTVGYEIGRAMKVSRLSVNLAGSFLAGESGMQVDLRLFPIDLTLEKAWTLVPKIAFYGDVGPSATIFSVRVPTVRQNTAVFDGAAFGLLLRAGFERALTDELALRIEGFLRMNLSAASYDGGSGPVEAAFEHRSDHFNQIGSTLALSLTL
jgi:hypothetical protein